MKPKRPIVLPDNILTRMADSDRAALGSAGITSADAQAKYAERDEKKMHAEFINDMQRRGIVYLTSRFGRKATITPGWPDFTLLWGGKVCCVEFKAKGGKLQPVQEKCIAELQEAGVPVLVAYSLADAIQFVRNVFFPTQTT